MVTVKKTEKTWIFECLDHGHCTVSEIRDLTGLPDNVIKTHLNELLSEGKIRTEGKGRAKRYETAGM